MKRFLIQLSYKGTRYVGWQIQPNGSSIQEEIEKAMSTLLQENIRIFGQGRTDAGVHALNSYAHFDLENYPKMSLEQLIFKLNRFLPKDIAIKNIVEVSPLFHARFSAESRSYLYIISTQKNPFTVENSWLLNKKPNIYAMQEAAKYIIGEHDFSSFCSAKSSLISKKCRVYQADWEEVDEQFLFKIKANRFVMNMVRSLVGTMTEIGLGKKSVEDMPRILQAADRKAAGPNADPAGLHLVDVAYPQDLQKWKTKE